MTGLHRQAPGADLAQPDAPQLPLPLGTVGPRTSLHQQASAVERMAVNHRGFCDVLRGLVDRGKRPPHELAQALSWVRALEDGALTMRRLADHAGTDAA
jgi:hypothetical protein